MRERLTDDSEYLRKNPFGVPEGYFDTIGERLEARIRDEENPNLRGPAIIRLIKPALWLAASFALAFLIIYVPVGKILNRYSAKQEKSQTPAGNMNEELLIGYDALDDNTFFMALTSSEDTTIHSEEVISYMASGMNDYELFSELAY